VAPYAQNSTCEPGGVPQMHLYSHKSLIHHIRWSIHIGDTLLYEFDEKPRVIQMEQGLQYARLIGSSPHLVPLADVMPTSLASTLGFVDEWYSLVALEEDAMPADMALQYQESGVPLLLPEEIFAAPEERYDLPVADWLAANPPQPMSRFNCGQQVTVIPLVNPESVHKTKEREAVAPEPDQPPDGQEYDLIDEPTTYISAAPALLSNMPKLICFIQSGHLVINLAQFSSFERSKMEIIIYDIQGRVVARWSPGRIAGTGIIKWNMRIGSSGLYLVVMKIGKRVESRKIMLVR
jgi:hypothetical protein